MQIFFKGERSSKNTIKILIIILKCIKRLKIVWNKDFKSQKSSEVGNKWRFN